MNNNTVVTLTLLNPNRLTPVRSWTFERESVIRIGRSLRNHVVLYSSVVSRYHVELRYINEGWQLISLGSNGTYLDGRPVNQYLIQDGEIIHLAPSGPKVRFSIQQQSRRGTSAQKAAQMSASQGQAIGTAMVPELETQVDPTLQKPKVNLSTPSDDVTEADPAGSREDRQGRRK